MPARIRTSKRRSPATGKRIRFRAGYDDRFYPGLSDVEVGAGECKTVDVNLPLDDRVVEEVRQYAQRYGFASWADVVEEWNSRCKDLEHQGKTYRYAYTDIPLIQGALDRLVRSGRLKRIQKDGITGYYV